MKVGIFNKIRMDQIDLIKKKEGEENEQKDMIGSTRLHSRRPEKLSISKVVSGNEKWKECKIIGKNISIRSYSSACAFQNKLYVYGGYQILRGNMNDFYFIDLHDQVPKFEWVPIKSEGDVPGPRSKHALIASKTHIYLIGGLETDIKSSNKIYCFDAETCAWKLMAPQGDSLPALDSFACAYVERDGDEKVIIFGGWNGERAEFLNSAFEYNITKNKVKTLFEGSKEQSKGNEQFIQDFPVPRCGCAAASDGKNVYIFGGKDDEHRYNDLWEFNLTDYKFRELEKKGDILPERNGHTINYYEGCLYVFGGIHDITWELDDLHIYNLAKREWETLEVDSPRKVQKKKQESKEKEKQDKKSPKKKNWYETANSLYGNKSGSKEVSPPPRIASNFSNYREEESQLQSPGKMLDEQKKKVLLQKKNELLRNFEIQKKEKDRYITYESESQAMKNSLDAIGNPNPKEKVSDGRLTDFGRESESKFLQPLENNSNLIIGKKPCARDGHCSVMMEEELIIFGGDRHQMSFNDIHKLNFSLAKKNA